MLLRSPRMGELAPKNGNTFRKSDPWWFTDEVNRKYLARAVPYMKGRLLDAGCGEQHYRSMFQCDEYIGIEHSARFNPDVVGDIRDMNMFSDAEFDSVLSTQVLEHVDDVDAVFSEFRRVLRPGGYLCLTVPFIARVHGEPYDFWRFSSYGIASLLAKHGFDVVFIQPMGGFLTTQCYLWLFYQYTRTRGRRTLRFLSRVFTRIANPLFLLFHRFDKDVSTPFNYIALGRKAE